MSVCVTLLVYEQNSLIRSDDCIFNGDSLFAFETWLSELRQVFEEGRKLEKENWRLENERKAANGGVTSGWAPKTLKVRIHTKTELVFSNV